MAEPSFTFAGEVSPVCEIGLSETRQAEPTSWLDVSCYVHEAEVFRGRERFHERFEPGTASVTFANDDGWADLGGTYVEVAAATLRPGRQIRVGVHGPWSPGMAPFVRWLYRGFIDQATPVYDPTLHDTVVIQCIDALGEAGQSTAPQGELQGVNEVVSDRINRVLGAVGWWTSKRKVDASPTTVQGTTLGGSGIDHMGQAADSAGGVVFGDLDGDVVFRGIDWMLYDPDTPPDATIGPGDPGAPPGDTPPYIDPAPGPVFDPDDPPALHPPKVCVCADGTAGTLIEKGDNYRLYVRGGHLFYESSGTTWDLGPYSGGCTCVQPPSGGGGGGDPGGGGEPEPPVRTDYPGDNFPPDGDPGGDGGGEISPFPPVEIPAVFGVELLAWNDGGLSDPPAAAVTVAGIHPGRDCIVAVLVNALGTATNATGLAPTVTGGGLDYAHRRDSEQPGDGASSYIVLAPVGRSDPGTFSVAVTWVAGLTSRSHIVTVWKITAAAEDYLARFDAGLVLYAATPVESEPGNGPTVVDLLADRQPPDVAVNTRAVDITIAQSLAEEVTGPFGAVLAETNGPWTIVPDGGDVAGAWVDDFERTDIGPDWELGLYTSPAASANEALHLATLVDGAATGPNASPILGPQNVMSMARVVGTGAGNQSIEVQVENLWQTISDGYVLSIEIATYADPDTGFASVAQFGWQAGDATVGVSVLQYNDVGTIGDFGPLVNVPVPPLDGVTTLRLDSDVTGHQVVTFNGSVVVDYAGPPPLGSASQQAISMNWRDPFFAAGSPRILQAGSAAGALVRKTSWVAGWRVGVASPVVELDDVNVGASDIQSTQACLVAESPEPEGGWRVLDADLRASVTGLTAAGSITLDNAPRPGTLLVVFVGVTASTDVLDAISVTGADFTRSFVRTQSGASWGQGAVYVAVAPLDYDPAAWAVQVTYPDVESISALAYEVAVQDEAVPVGVHAANVLGTNTAGSVDGASTITLTGAGDPASVVLAYIHASADAVADNGAAPFDGSEWTEEYQSPAVGWRAYAQSMSRAPGQPESTSTAVVWADVQTGSGPAYSAVQLAIEIHPFDGLPATPGGSGVYLGGVDDPWNGTIGSAGAYDPVTAFPIWGFP